MTRWKWTNLIFFAIFLLTACGQGPSRSHSPSPHLSQEGVKPSAPNARVCDRVVAFQSMLRRMHERLPNSELETYRHVERQALVSAFLMNEVLRVYGSEEASGFNIKSSGHEFLFALDVLSDADAFWREKPNYRVDEECFRER